MKLTKNIFLFCALIFSLPMISQVRKSTPDKKPQNQSTNLTVRAKSFIENSNDAQSNNQWSRIIYSELDLNNGPNASLYFPEEPLDGYTNLFRLVINLLSEGKIKAYEYLDGREIFSEKYELNVKDMLDKFYIVYEEQAAKGRGSASYTIDETDVPCNEVLSYFIKERWTFDQIGSKMSTKIDAICPLLHRSGDFGSETTKYPMFWIKYDDLKPYLLQHLIMSDGINNTMRHNFDDFFVMRKYKGDIYKTMNLQNKTLMQLYPDADSLKIAREKIENELKSFESSLWVPQATPQVDRKSVV